ncbi:hypothetical protein D9611_001965 [Ephemerocybe angulata]|uniref:Protein-tyrosine-phosphatase n=1 Tax=Ephemerocybe angulata TaxID=980116 RepID=A0A8H5CIW7_9AGAR|nr:hypothetical protein D9611_001965 [Tulosesus angulatus]
MNHGLEYPPGLLDTLAVVSPAPTPSLSPSSPMKPPRTPQPIRLLPPSLFTSLHRTHLLAHPPDHVLFPFLHGLEGDNDAQNTFFANAAAGSHWVVGVEVPVVPPAGHGKMPKSHASLMVQGAISSSSASAKPAAGLGGPVVQHHQLLRPKVPRYRGLVWVVCEEDVKGHGDRVTLSVLRRKALVEEGEGVSADMHDDDDDDDDESGTSSWDEDEEMTEDSDLELDADDEREVRVVDAADEQELGEGIPPKAAAALSKEQMDQMPYMHPVISPHAHPTLSSINTSFTSPASTDTEPDTTTTTSSSISINSDAGSVASTAPTSVSGSPTSPSPSYPQVIQLEEVEAPLPGSPATATTTSSAAPLKDVEAAEEESGNKKRRKDKDIGDLKKDAGVAPKTKRKRGERKTDPAAPPLLTCTFRPKELLRKRRVPAPGASSAAAAATADGEKGEAKKGELVWEFVPARVPDGISLRNFGIQMPIYATISDIVIYSPSGPTKATVALAERFRQAIERKRKERVKALKGVVYSQVHQGHGSQQQQQGAGSNPFIRIEDVLKAEREKRDAERAERKKGKAEKEKVGKADAEKDKGAAEPQVDGEPPSSDLTPPTSSSDGPTSATLTPSSPSPSDSDSDSSSYSYTSDIDDEEEEDLETRMLDTAERYLLSLVEDDLLDYNVFILDGGEDEMRKVASKDGGGMAHLMMRSCGSGVPGGVDHGRVGVIASSKGSSAATGPHTIRSDGELQGEKEVEARADLRASVERMDVDVDSEGVLGDMDVDAQGGGDYMLVDHQTSKEDFATQNKEQVDDDDDLPSAPIPNTVDFALREKEEMRDLTKASEIISLFPSSKYGDRSSPPGTATGMTFKPWTASPLDMASPASTSSTPLSGQGQPLHLQHLSKLIPPSSPSRSPTVSSFQGQQAQTPTVEYAFTHPDTSVDISSPATFYDPLVGQVFLGNSGDVPLAANAKPGVFTFASGKVARTGSREPPQDRQAEDKEGGEKEEGSDEELGADDPFSYAATNDPASGFGYDICIECHEMAPFPTPAHVRAAEEHLSVLEVMWRDRCVEREKAKRNQAAKAARLQRTELDPKIQEEKDDGLEDGDDEEDDDEDESPIIVPPRPPPHANAVIHLPFPSSPPNTQQTMAQLIPVMRFLEKWIRPVPGEVKIEVEVRKKKDTTPTPASTQQEQNASGVRRWSSSVANLMPSVFGGGSNTSAAASPPLSTTSARSRSFTTPAPSSHHRNSSTSSATSAGGSPAPTHPTRPLKLLLYSADGYTESSLGALCLLMSIKGLTLPEAYLDLQVGKRRSFFVYSHDLGVLRRVESRLIEERERERERAQREKERQELERMVREAREREVRERVAREERAGRSEEETGVMLNANGKRTIGSVHGGAVGGPGAAEKGPGGGLSLFKVFGGGSVPPPRAASPASGAAGGTGGKPAHAFKGRPAAKSVSFSQAPKWGQATQQGAAAASSQAPSGAFRVPPTIPQGVPVPSPSGHISLRPPEEYTGSLPVNAGGMMHQQRKEATLPPTPSGIATSSSDGQAGGSGAQRQTGAKRPRANTSPWLPSFFGGDHQSWFNDPRFDGSFPSRVLPFLYLGNLNHASNVYMLHALGITHVVSVGECALLPPPYHMVGHGSGGGNASNAGPACSPRAPHHSGHGNGSARSGHGSLWIEEREGRIKVLDIKGVCDDGIDTLEPQLEPICDWIDKAREEGGQVLVHCRVGVSRSATVTIAYVMKHLSLPLVDAYLIVRSRRLSVLIQPNMRLLYNLCGWEIKLAKERAGWVEDDENGSSLMGAETKGRERVKMERRLERELARTLTWPYLSMEVHKLNEKYLH